MNSNSWANGSTSDALPSYEDSVEQTRLKYQLKYPKLISRAVHATSLRTGKLVVVKRVKGLTQSKSQFYRATGEEGEGEEETWSCKRERDGYELIFTKPRNPPDEFPPPPLPPPPPLEEPPISLPSFEAAPAEETVLVDNKPADDSREYVHQENDMPPPPAYDESDAPSRRNDLRIVLKSPHPHPFVYDFAYPLGDEALELSWVRNLEAKNQTIVSPQHPWAAFRCVDKQSGRPLAEILYTTAKDPSLGTLVINDMEEMEPLAEFLLVSGIAISEEYPVRQIPLSKFI